MWASVAGVLAFAPYAAAQTTNFDVVVHAPSACPPDVEFVRQINVRTLRYDPTVKIPRRTFIVDVAIGEPPGFTGRVIIRSGRDPDDVRVVPGKTCDEVVSAMALIAALTIDPRASTKPLAPLSAEPPNVPLHPAFVTTAPVKQLPAAVAPASVPSTRWRFGAGAGAAWTGAVAPQAVLGWTAFVDAAYTSGLKPLFRLAAHHATSAATATTAGEADFSFTAARATACPLQCSIGAGLSGLPCAFADVGVLGAHASRTQNASSPSIVWGAAGLLGRLEWELGRGLVAGGEGGLLLPFVRDSYYFSPNFPVHKVPAASFVAAIDIGVRLP